VSDVCVNEVYLVSDVCSKWVIYTFGVSARDGKSTFFRMGGYGFYRFPQIFWRFSVGYMYMHVYACACVCVCVCVCVCMRVIPFADVVLPTYNLHKRKKCERHRGKE